MLAETNSSQILKSSVVPSRIVQATLYSSVYLTAAL